MIIYKAQVEKAQVQNEMKKLDSQIDVLKRSGLEKEAKMMLPHYNSLVTKAAELSNTAEKQRRKTSLALLACFVCADLATNAAEQFSDVCDEVCFGGTKADNDFVRLMKFNAETSAKRWNELVCIFDKGVENFNLSSFYVDFSEEIVNKLLPMLNDEVSKVMETKKGQRWL